MRIKDYSALIENLPYKNQSFIVKANNWSKYSTLCSDYKLFEDNSEIRISRKDLFEASTNTKLFIIKTLMWGYPNGGRGGNIKKVLDTSILYKVSEILDGYRNQNISHDQFITDLKRIHGLGISTITKFLYFLNTKVNGYPSLILDERIMRVVSEGVFEELNELGKLRRENASKKYPKYLKLMNELAEDIKVKPDQLELFLFMFGQNLKE